MMGYICLNVSLNIRQAFLSGGQSPHAEVKPPLEQGFSNNTNSMISSGHNEQGAGHFME